MREAGSRGGGGRPPGNRRWAGAGCGTLLLVLVQGVASAGTFEGRAGLETEYLGDSYRSTLTFSAEDLGLPAGSSLLLYEATTFAEDTWLPGALRELAWRSRRLEATSRTAHNAERTTQELDVGLETAPPGASRWGLRAGGAFREDDRSLVGHGDWEGRLELRRESVLGRTVGSLDVRWEHARTRGDTVSYLYDYDVLRARAGLRGSGWLPRWDTYIEGIRKAVPAGEPGSYAEIRAGGTRRGAGEGRLSLQVRYRDLDSVSVGRDRLEVETSMCADLGRGREHGWRVTGEATWTNASGQDDLTFDALQGELGFPWHRSGALSLEAGPVLTGLRDLDGGERDYLQGSLRGSAGLLGGTGGIADLTVEGGYRDYQSNNAQVVEIASLSGSLLRTDYWLIDTLLIVHWPAGASVSFDLTASWSWEFHPRDDERIQIAFATAGVSRAF